MRKQARQSKPQVRVVMSLHLSREDHTAIAKAAQKVNLSVAQFVRSAAVERVERLAAERAEQAVA